MQSWWFCVQLTLSAGVSSSRVIVMLTWTGNDVHQTLSNTMQQISGTITYLHYVISTSASRYRKMFVSMRFVSASHISIKLYWCNILRYSIDKVLLDPFNPSPYTPTHIQWRCMSVIVWPLDIRNVLRPEWGCYLNVGGAREVVR